MRNFWALQAVMNMPDIDWGTFGSNCGTAARGGHEGPAIASAATITVSAPVHKITGTTEITTINPPATGFVGRILLIATAAWTTNVGGNIAKAFTAVANEGTEWYYDGSTWYPVMGD